jgi:hypothetical protein
MRCVPIARPAGVVFVLLAVFVTGCGPGGNTGGGALTDTDTITLAAAGNRVGGSVKLNDKPVNYGVVAFHIGDRIVKAPIDPQGNYSINNPPPGEAKVVLLVPPNPPQMAAAGGPPTEPPPKFVPVSVPAKYADKATTDLTFTVGTGQQTYDIQMKAD